MKFSILSKPNNFFSKSSIKEILRTILGKVGGPFSVEQSLKRGLKKINGIEYNFNPHENKLFETVIVIQGVDTLAYALKLKKEGKIKKLLAGPNIIVSTNDSDGILKDSAIDKVIVPSKWVKDAYTAETLDMGNKIEIWPAGVENTGEISDKSDGFIIYFKNSTQELLADVKSVLTKKNLPYKLFEYGKYKKNDYFKELNTAKGVIFLSQSESQGLALQETWIRNVPTLVWNRGYMQSGNAKWSDEKISAPYLTGESGIFFKDSNEFEKKFDEFNSKNFKPRKYCLENLTDEICAKKLLNIIEK